MKKNNMKNKYQQPEIFIIGAMKVKTLGSHMYNADAMAPGVADCGMDQGAPAGTIPVCS